MDLVFKVVDKLVVEKKGTETIWKIIPEIVVENLQNC